MKKLLRKTARALRLLYKQPQGFKDYCLGLFSALIKSKKAIGMPVHITVEPVNICNLSCPVCETGSGVLGRSKGMLKFEDFKLIIDKISNYANTLFFYYMGEPFLNPEAYRMIRYAKAGGLYIKTCTNGHFIDAAQMMDSGIDEISFQIGGLTNETHTVYRVGSNLNEIIENIKKLIAERKRQNKKRPKIILGFIVMKANESEVEKFPDFAQELGVDEARIMEPCVRTIEQAKVLLPEDTKYWIYDRAAFDQGDLRPKIKSNNRCNWIYLSTVILSNGDLVPCCRDPKGELVMGNIFLDSMERIWNGKKYRDFRVAISRHQKDLALCKLCCGFQIPTLYENISEKLALITS